MALPTVLQNVLDRLHAGYSKGSYGHARRLRSPGTNMVIVVP